MQEFFGPQEQKKSNRKPPALYREQNRMAALDWMRAIDNQLRAGVGIRLAHFMPDKQRVSELAASSELTIEAARKYAPVLTIAMDQASCQYASSWFLQFRIGLNVVSTWDPAAHRIWNDVKAAIRDSKLMSTMYATTVIFNYKSGPWASSAWHKAIIECIADMARTLAPNDPLLLRVWPSICRDKGWVLESEVGEDARAEFVSLLCTSKETQSKGEQVALSRWFSWMHKEHAERPEWHTRMLALLFYNIMHGNLSRSWQIFQDAARIKVPVMAASSSEAPAAGEQHEAREATRTDHMAASAEGVQALRQRCRNTLHVCLELCADIDLHERSKVIGVVCGAFTTEHGNDMRNLRSERAVQQKYTEWALGGWVRAIEKTLGVLTDLGQLGICGLTIDVHQERGVEPC